MSYASYHAKTMHKYIKNEMHNLSKEQEKEELVCIT